MSYILEDMVKMLNAVTEALNKSNERSDKIVTMTESWVALADNESLPPSTRATYLTCAEEITAIMSGET